MYGVYIAATMWLVPDDPQKPFYLNNARYLCAIGGTALDDYRSKVKFANLFNASRQDSNIPRHKIVTTKPR